MMRGVGDEDLMVFDALAHLPEKPVQCGNDTKDLSRDRAADIAQVIGGSVLDRIFKSFKGRSPIFTPNQTTKARAAIRLAINAAARNRGCVTQRAQASRRPVDCAPSKGATTSRVFALSSRHEIGAGTTFGPRAL